MSHLIVGRIGSTFGIKGWLKIISYTDPQENILTYSPWQLFINGKWQIKHIVDCKPHGQGLIALLKGYSNPEEARLLANVDIAIDRMLLPALPVGEYYWADLIGLKVVNQQAIELGVINSLFDTGANDVMVVKGEKETLIPYIKQVVLGVDINAKLMQVDWDLD